MNKNYEEVWYILQIDDDEEDNLITRDMLAKTKGRKVILDWAATYEEGLKKLQQNLDSQERHYDVVLIDYDLGTNTGIDIIRKINVDYAVPLILFTGRGSYEVDLEAMEAGATLYVTKYEVNPSLLERTIRYAIELKQKETDLRSYRERLEHELAERRQAVAARRFQETLFQKSQERSQAVWEITQDAMALSDPQGTVLAANPAYCELYGFTLEEVLGENFAIIFPEGQRANARQQYLEVFASPTLPPAYEATIQRKDGQVRTVESRVSFIVEGGQRTAMLSVVRDISELKRAEAERDALLTEVQRQKNLLEGLVANSPMGIAVLRGPEHRFALINPAQRKLFPTIPEFLGHTVAEIWPDQQDTFMPILDRVYQAGEPYFAVDAPWQTDKGNGYEQAFYTFSYTPLYGPGGRIEGIIVLSIETTEQVKSRQLLQSELAERCQIEMALRESEENLRLILDASPDLIWSSPPDGKADFVNRAWREYTGLTLEKLQNAGWEVVNHPEDVEGLKQAWEGAAQKLEPIEVEYRYRGRDGNYRWFWGRTAPVIDGQGNLFKWVGYSRDITARKQAEETIRRSEGLYRMLAANLPNGGVFLVDHDLRYLLAEGQGLELAGFTSKDFEGKTLWEALSPEIAKDLEPFYRSALKGTPFQREHYMFGRDYLSQGVPVRDEQGQVVAALAMSYDITDRKRAERDLQRYAAELERSNQALQEFASIASHDLQEPLRKVISFGKMLETRFNSQLEAEGRDYLSRMTSASERMQEIITSLLSYSRITSQKAHFEPVNLHQVAREVLSDLELRLKESGGRVEVNDLPVIQADPLQMRQLMQNLIANALKYHRPGVPPQIVVGCRSAGEDRVEVFVQDNGIGIHEVDTGRIFKPFVRLHGRSEYEGSGMGLAICLKIVERHGGSIRVESAVNEGSTFTVQLPERQ